VEKEARYLLHLLGAYLRNEKPEIWPEINWDSLIELAYSHNLVGTLGYMADSYPICPEPRKVAQLRQFYLTTLMGFANRGALAEEFSQTLEDNDIDHVLMKGFILRNLFPVPELRTYGDIDLVIRPEDREKSHTLMKELGFQIKTDWEPVYGYTKENEFYEIHTELLETDVSPKVDCRAYFRGLWDHVVPMGEHRYQFEPEYHFLYMIAHIAKHVAGSGAGIRMYLDVAAFILHYGENLDWEKVTGELESLGLRSFANGVFTMVQQYLGIRSPVALTPVVEAVIADFAELTMKGGIFGRNGQDGGTVSLREESRRNGDLSRTRTIAKRLFPSAQTIQTRYTYLQDKPWLLPAAWVHRLIKTRGSWKNHAEQAQQILSADMGEVRRLNALYQEFGL
jgi:hypothetical protein